MPNDRAIVHKKEIGQAAETFERFVFHRCRSARRSGFRSWPRPGNPTRAGANDAAACRAASRRDWDCPEPPPGTDLRSADRRRRTIGASGEVSSCSSSSATSAHARTCSSDGNMTANGFSSRCLRARRLRTASWLRASTRSWKPPRPLRATIFPARICSAAWLQARRPRRRRSSPNEFQNCSCGPQTGQAVGSAWKRRSAGSRYSPRAVLAHREFLHRGVGPIVGERLDDGETRTAIGAVGKGIAKAAIVRVENFAQTILAGREVGQNERGLPALVGAFPDLEVVVTDGIEMGRLATLDDGAGRLLRFQPAREIRKCFRRAFDFDEDALRRVHDPALESEFSRQPIDKGTETDALDRAAHDHFQASANRRESRGRRLHLTKSPSTKPIW